MEQQNENQEQINQTAPAQAPAPKTEASAPATQPQGFNPERRFQPRGRGNFGGPRQGGQGGGFRGNREGGFKGGKEGGFRRGGKFEKPEKLFDTKTIDLARVTRVTGGGKKMSFRATVIIGDKKGKVGLGIAKGKDVAMANEKAGRYAKKAMFTVPVVNGTIPHLVSAKAGSAMIMMKPQLKGRGIVAGGAARVICSMAGIKNVTAKYLGTTKNNLNNARACIEALKKLKVSKKAEVKTQGSTMAIEKND